MIEISSQFKTINYKVMDTVHALQPVAFHMWCSPEIKQSNLVTKRALRKCGYDCTLQRAQHRACMKKRSIVTHSKAKHVKSALAARN
jgi:hypothetical protein